MKIKRKGEELEFPTRKELFLLAVIVIMFWASLSVISYQNVSLYINKYLNESNSITVSIKEYGPSTDYNNPPIINKPEVIKVVSDG